MVNVVHACRGGDIHGARWIFKDGYMNQSVMDTLVMQVIKGVTFIYSFYGKRHLLLGLEC
jgi:hypothetical protein